MSDFCLRVIFLCFRFAFDDAKVETKSCLWDEKGHFSCELSFSYDIKTLLSGLMTFPACVIEFNTTFYAFHDDIRK